MTDKTLGVILAGGEARRMGGAAKGLLPLGGKRLLDHVLARALPQLEGCAISLRGTATAYADITLPVIWDASDRAEGPLAGVLAGLTYAQAQGFDRVLTLPCDTPFLPHDLRARLAEAQKQAACPIALAATDAGTDAPRRHPSVALCDVACTPLLAELFATGMRALNRAYGEIGLTHTAWRPAPIDPFLNINSPSDLAQAEAWLQSDRGDESDSRPA